MALWNRHFISLAADESTCKQIDQKSPSFTANISQMTTRRLIRMEKNTKKITQNSSEFPWNGIHLKFIWRNVHSQSFIVCLLYSCSDIDRKRFLWNLLFEEHPYRKLYSTHFDFILNANGKRLPLPECSKIRAKKTLWREWSSCQNCAQQLKKCLNPKKRTLVRFGKMRL